MARTYGSYMMQPTKDQFRNWLSDARSDLKIEKARRRATEQELGAAKRKLGQLVLEGKIAISLEKLGEIALEIASEEEALLSLST